MAYKGSTLGKFDPADHPADLFDAFINFIDAFAYEYEAITKEPPSGESDVAKWHDLNRRKQFLGKFASRNFQKDFEDCVPLAERATLTFTELVTKIKERYNPTKNSTLTHYEFHKLKQASDETFDAFINRVKHEAQGCDFKCKNPECNVKDTLIRDQVLIGTTNAEILKNALKEQWSLVDLGLKGRQMEAASRGAAKITQDGLPEEISVNRVGGRYSKKRQMSQKKQVGALREERPSKCHNCKSRTCKGGKKCYGYGKECYSCGEAGHIKGARACKVKGQKSRQIHYIVEESSSSSSEDPTSDEDSSDDEKPVNRIVRPCRFIGHVRRAGVKCKKKERSRYEVDVVVKENIVTMFADTGADISVISKGLADKLQLPLQSSRMKIRPYGSQPMKCLGYYVGAVMFDNRVANIRIYVVDKEVEPLLSGYAAEALGIITLNSQTEDVESNKSYLSSIKRVASTPYGKELMKKFPECFKGIGKLKNHQVKLFVDDNVPPVACPPRPVPFHLQDRMKVELDKMEKAGIIEDHEGPAPWVSNTVLAPKNDGGVRITVDMRRPNEAIKDTNIPIPRAEDIRSRMAGNVTFSKLDFKSAFHQLELEPESRHLTVFNDGRGGKLKRYTRLTMGTKPASGELNKALIPLFAHLPDAHVIHDDIIVASKSKEEHLKVLEMVMKVIKESGLSLNAEKCIFAQDSVPFWGMIISKDGVHPDPAKVESLKLAGRPKSKEEVMSFLCLIQSNAEFIPNLAQSTVNLRELTKKNVRFRWSEQCDQEFSDLKEAFRKDTLLRHFDSTKQTYIYVDAHKTGLSAMLKQGNNEISSQLVACTSRATSPVERRYPQLDLEALAIDFALRRFRQYLAGGPQAIVITDHKPLVSIFSNTRKGSIRTDRIKLRHQDISYKVIWKEGKSNQADYLSRHAVPLSKIPKEWQEECTELEKTVWFLQFSPYTEAISMDKIIKKTDEDPVLKKLKEAVKEGYINKNDKILKPFQGVMEEIMVSDSGLLLRGDRIILPEVLKTPALRKAHQGGHPGETRLKQRLRAHFWFPKMSSRIKEYVQKCSPCQLFTGKTTKEPIAPIEGPADAWSEVNVDLFGPMPNRQHVLVVQDSFSRFPAAKIVDSTGAKPVLTALDGIYDSYGNPRSHRTDNGPPFNSMKFANYSRERGIKHKKVYEYHPQANPVETLMKPLGKAVKIANYTGISPDKAVKDFIQGYRDTPHTSLHETPGNIMFRHGYRTQLPRLSPISEERVAGMRKKDLLQKRERADKFNSSRKTTKAKLKKGDIVIIAKKDRKSKFDPKFEPRNYKIQDQDKKGVIVVNQSGKTKRRHKNDVKKTLTPIEANDHFYWNWNSREERDEETPMEELEDGNADESQDNLTQEEDSAEEHDEESPVEDLENSNSEEGLLDRIQQRAKGKRKVILPERYKS